MKRTHIQEELEKMAYRPREFCKAFGIRKSKLYLELKTKRLKSIKVGKARLITKQAAEQWLSNWAKKA